MKTVRLIASLFLLPSLVWAQTPPPDGWRFPSESDYIYAWKEFRASHPTPFHAQADFNGDGLSDDVWILLSTHNKAWGLFLFEAKKTGSPRVVTLDVNDPEKEQGGGSSPQSMGVGIAPPGDHVTACGKGYWACKKGEPKVLRLVRPGVEYFQFESAKSIFWWDEKAKNFKRTWISD